MQTLSRSLTAAALLLLSALFVAGCSPEVGSDAWCAKMKEKEAGNWTANEAADYAKHCVLK